MKGKKLHLIQVMTRMVILKRIAKLKVKRNKRKYALEWKRNHEICIITARRKKKSTQKEWISTAKRRQNVKWAKKQKKTQMKSERERVNGLTVRDRKWVQIKLKLKSIFTRNSRGVWAKDADETSVDKWQKYKRKMDKLSERRFHITQNDRRHQARG